jgi:hypothetical protein
MADSEQGTHFWFLTIQMPGEGGTTSVGSYQGTLTPSRKETRLDALNKLRDLVAKQYPKTKDGVVLAFDIQPNKL